jgi:hypothetical protein
MNRFVMGTLGVATLVLLGASFASAQERTFTGLITDEKLNCIQSPMKVLPPAATEVTPPPEGRGGGGGGARGGGGRGGNARGRGGGEAQAQWTKETCVLYWAHYADPKEKIVVYDPDTKTTYFVDDENWILPYAGDTGKVTVTGTYNEATKTISHIARVQSK